MPIRRFRLDETDSGSECCASDASPMRAGVLLPMAECSTVASLSDDFAIRHSASVLRMHFLEWQSSDPAHMFTAHASRVAAAMRTAPAVRRSWFFKFDARLVREQ